MHQKADKNETEKFSPEKYSKIEKSHKILIKASLIT